jgi:spore coat protein U-like protein
MKTTSSFHCPGVVLTMVCLCVSNLAQAVTAAGQQTVRAKVNPSCTMALGTALAFGNLILSPTLNVVQKDANGTFTVTCTNGTNYTLAVGDGDYYSGGRRMANGSGQYLGYQLHMFATRNSLIPSGFTASFTSNSSAATFTMYGRVPAQTATTPGNFTDAVTFTITY